MNKAYNRQLKTLVDFRPGDFADITGAPPTPAAEPQATTPPTVPTGRTTVNLATIQQLLNRKTTPTAAPAQAEQAAAVPPLISATPPASIPPADPLPTLPATPPPPPEETAAEPVFEQQQDEPPLMIPDPPDPRLIPKREPQSETAAALRVQQQKPRKKPAADPQDSILVTMRWPLFLKDTFYKTCHDRGQTPAIVLRNLAKSYCGLCLVLILFAANATAQQPPRQPQQTRTATATTGEQYTTHQILDYFYRKTFTAAGTVPNIRGTIGARHALWQTGRDDPIDDFVYSDYSNTRLEARIEIPIFDLSHYRNRDREKITHRANVMKGLSAILAAQKHVRVIENNLTTVRARQQYVKGQVDLRLANRSDLFSIEDNILNLQAQQYEAQSRLEQRIIDLAMLAGNDWEEAYKMIIKWDGNLFDNIR